MPPKTEFAFRHIVNTPNVGDIACGPYLYFDFPNHRVEGSREEWQNADKVIFGGGNILDWVFKSLDYSLTQTNNLVTWGIGGDALKAGNRVRKIAERGKLISTREHTFAQHAFFVPCVSCMSEHFDTLPDPEHEVVMFAHADKLPALSQNVDIPLLTNHGGTLKDTLRFIASGETVVTSSYHGTYWALLMGRKVICVPFSGKFRGYRWEPTYARPGNWKNKVTQAKSYSGLLQEARDLNMRFYERVMNL